MKFRYYNPQDNTLTYSEGFKLSKFFEMYESTEGAVLMRSMGALDDNQKEVYQGDKFNGFTDSIQYYSVDVDEGNTNMSLFINGVRYLWGTFENGKKVLEDYNQFKVQGNIYTILNSDQKGKGMDAYFKDLEDYENEFMCNECGEDEKKGFGYNRTVSNGEVWTCKNCKTELLVSNRPNEDNY